MAPLFVHDEKTSCNDMRERIPSRLPLAKDGSNMMRHWLDKEPRNFFSSLALLFCLELDLPFDNLAKYCPIK
jgi:hypothetical protein